MIEGYRARYSLSGYLRKIKSIQKQVKIVAIEKVSSWKSVPQSSGSWEEAACVEFTTVTTGIQRK